MSSEPIPTLLPGWNLVPLWRTMILPALTFSPPKDGIKITFRAVCVNPNFLRMGLATYLHKSAIKHYQKRGCLVAELWNVCRESYKLGISMGFIQKRENNKSDEVSMVKILVDTRKQNCNAKIRFVVWSNTCICI